MSLGADRGEDAVFPWLLPTALLLSGPIISDAPDGSVPSVHIVPEADDPTRVIVRSVLTPTAVGQLQAGEVPAAVGRRFLTLSLYDAATRTTSDAAILGRYEAAGLTLSFRPAFALARGETYRAQAFIDGPSGPEYRADARYEVPKLGPAPPTTVVRIAPRDIVLPANVLRFYVHFSRPMREGREVLENIRLFDEGGNEIGSPWRDLELWNADATRLSLFVHPGRIKQGVNLREQLGSVLMPGRAYQIQIDRKLRDARGEPLADDVNLFFSTTVEERTRVDVKAWRMAVPAAESRDPLVIDFGRPLDDAIALRTLRFLTQDGAPIGGGLKLSDDQRSCIFTPQSAWRRERYLLDVDPVLEDVCGNTPLRAFDFDLDTAPTEAAPPMLRREFTPQ